MSLSIHVDIWHQNYWEKEYYKNVENSVFLLMFKNILILLEYSWFTVWC